MTNQKEQPVHNSLVEGLMRPDAYPHAVDTVRLVETHVSHLFFAGGFVYKVKKPVNMGFLDFTTLEKRRYYCEREIELNSRLSPGVYEGIVPICEQDGAYKVEASGGTVEYALKMRELPLDKALDQRLRDEDVSIEDIRRIAVRIADFHNNAATGPEVSKLGDIDVVRQNIEENFEQTEHYIGLCVSQEEFDDLETYSRAFLNTKDPVFDRRTIEGRVKDGHGDLHSGNIFLENGIDIIDCIEFNDRFRCLDVAEDIAFLAMDLDHYGRPDLSEAFVSEYIEASGDDGVSAVLNFFKSYRAYVRGKVTAFRLDDDTLPDDERSSVMSTAKSYFQLAHKYALSELFPRPAIVMVVGLMGSGKTYISENLAGRWSIAHISTDLTRKELAGIGPSEHSYDAYGQGIYSPEFSRRTYDTMYNRARKQLESGKSVVLDGTFRDRAERERVLDIARSANADLWIIECVAPDDEIRRRLERRADGVEQTASDGRWDLFQQQKADWDEITEIPLRSHIQLNTSNDPQSTLRNLLLTLFSRILESGYS